MVKLVKHVSEPWFSLIACGVKTVEGRLEKSDFVGLRPGATITWTNDDLGYARRVVTRVASTRRYPTFRTYLRGETVAKALPTVSSVDRGVAIYRKYYDAVAEKEHGVLAIRLSRS
jgi:ASC-1-like (ASCH) protein